MHWTSFTVQLQNHDCAVHNHDQQFSTLAKAKTQYCLAVHEGIFIKTLKPFCAARKRLSILFNFC